MGETNGIFSQFALRFSTPEEMEAYKRKIAEERKQQLFEVDLQLFNAEAQESQPG